MASRNRSRSVAVEATVETPTITYAPSEGGNVIAAAWPGLFNLFGAQAQFDLGPDGFTVTGLTVADGYDADTIFGDIYRRGDKTVNPRLDYNSVYPIVRGIDPAPFTTANQLTAWMVKFIKGGSRSPKYAKDAIQAYKEAHGFAVHRGRPKKTFSIKDIGSLDLEALSDVDRREVEKLRATIDSLFADTEAVTAEAE